MRLKVLGGICLCLFFLAVIFHLLLGPFLGNLPGDEVLRLGQFQIYLPVATAVIVCFAISAILTFYLSKLKKDSKSSK